MHGQGQGQFTFCSSHLVYLFSGHQLRPWNSQQLSDALVLKGLNALIFFSFQRPCFTSIWHDRPDQIFHQSQFSNGAEWFIFPLLVTHPKSYIETTDRRDFGGKLSEWRWGRVLSWKIPEFYSVGGARSKNSIFRVLGYSSTIPRTVYRKQFYPNQWYRWKADSEGVPFASLESLWPGIRQI